MKHLVLIGLIVIAFSSCNQSALVIKESDIPEGIFYVKDQLAPYSGTCIVYYPGTHQIKEQLVYVDGLLNGEVTSYYSDGQKKRQGHYEKGKMNGSWEGWYENGSRKYVAHYKDDILDGEYTAWFENGDLKENGLFAMNVRSGDWIRNHENSIAVIE